MNMPSKRIASLLLSLVLLGGSLIPAGAHDKSCAIDATAAVSDILERWRVGVASANVSSLAGLYRDDAIIMDRMLGESQNQGRAGARAFYARLLTRHPMVRITLGDISTGCNSASGNGAVLVHVTGMRKGTRMLLMGKFRIVIEQSDGQWLITRHELELVPRPNRIAAGEP